MENSELNTGEAEQTDGSVHEASSAPSGVDNNNTGGDVAGGYGDAYDVEEDTTETVTALPDDKGGAPDNTVWLKLSKLISVLMHPLAMPTYIMLLLLFGGSVISLSPVRNKIFIILAVLLNTMVVPALSIGLLRTTGYLRDLSLDKRRDRTLPLLITAVCYAVCVYMVMKVPLVFMVHKFLIAGMVCIIAAFIITRYWKISLHMISAGAASAILVIMSISWYGMGMMLVPLIVIIALSGMLASARLYLGAHTPAQVGAGFILGFSLALASIFIF